MLACASSDCRCSQLASRLLSYPPFACREDLRVPSEKFTVGLVQMSCGPNPEENLAKALDRVAEAAQDGAQSSACLNSSRRSISVSAKTHALFDLAEPIPGPNHREARRRPPRSTASCWSRRCSRSARPASITTPRPSSTPMERCAGIYRKMHIPDDPLYYEKFYFTPGRPGFPRLRHGRGQDRHAGVLGPVVSGRRPPDRAAGRQ